MFKVPEQFRVKNGVLASDRMDGNNGAFVIPLPHNQTVNVIASDGGGWEHVSVSRRDRCPTWAEMHAIKILFWGDDCAVMQIHPTAATYVNMHPNCLHLWRPIGREIPVPPSFYV